MIEEDEFIEILDRIAIRFYGKHYFELCESRQRIVMNIYQAGDF